MQPVEDFLKTSFAITSLITTIFYSYYKYRFFRSSSIFLCRTILTFPLRYFCTPPLTAFAEKCDFLSEHSSYFGQVSFLMPPTTHTGDCEVQTHASWVRVYLYIHTKSSLILCFFTVLTEWVSPQLQMSCECNYCTLMLDTFSINSWINCQHFRLL